MRFHEQRATAKAFECLDDLPGILRVVDRVGADQRDRFIPQMRGHPDGAVFRVDDVGATPRVGFHTAGFDDLDQLVFLGVDDRHLVARIGGNQEIAPGAVKPAIMQEALGLDFGGFQVLDVGIVHHQHLAGFLDVDHEFRLEMRGHDRGDTRFRVVFLRVIDHATGAFDLERLKRVAVHDHILRRPIGPCDGVFVFPPLEFRGFDRTRLGADLDFGNGCRRVHPQVYHRDLGVTTNDIQIAARCRDAADMHRIARLDDRLDLIGFAVDQGNLAGIAQRHREQVVDVDVVHLFRRPFLGRHDDLPGLFHLGHAEFWRRGRVEQQIAGHHVDLLFGQLARGAPVRHARGRAISDKVAQIFIPVVAGNVGGQGFARRTLAQHAVAACAALEIDLVGLVVFFGRHHRIIGFAARDLDMDLAERVHARLVGRRRCVRVFLGFFLCRRARGDERKRDRRRGQERWLSNG